MTKQTELKSPNAKCRVIGCQTSAPWYGPYLGMPKYHCTRCGMKTHDAREGMDDFVEPYYPEADWHYRLYEWFLNLW